MAEPTNKDKALRSVISVLVKLNEADRASVVAALTVLYAKPSQAA